MENSKRTEKIQITCSQELYAKIEALSKELNISRSAAVNVMISQGFQYREGINAMSELMDAYKEEKAKKALQEGKEGCSDGE